MDHKQKSALAIAVAAGLGGVSAADAATYAATLTQWATYSSNGSSAGNIASSTATWSYDDVTNLVSQTGGTFNVRFTTAPTNTLFRTLTTGLIIGNGGAAGASTFACVEGNFGSGVGASICGNYGLGGNFANDSTTTWGPGTAASRTIGGDDIAYGPQQTIAALNGFNTVSYGGGTLVLSNANQALTNGYKATFSVVPVPAAVWLFGSALGLLGVARRKAVTA